MSDPITEDQRRAAYERLKARFNWWESFEACLLHGTRSRLIDIEVRHRAFVVTKIAARAYNNRHQIPRAQQVEEMPRFLSGKDRASGEKDDDE